MTQVMSLMGGGTGAEATYVSGTGSMSLVLVAESPMLEGMLPMFENEAMLAMMGSVVKIGGQAFLQEGGTDLVAVIGGRIMLRGSAPDSGSDAPSAIEALKALLATVDYPAIAAAGTAP